MRKDSVNYTGNIKSKDNKKVEVKKTSKKKVKE